MNGLALCAGIGGLELGLRHVWPDLRTIGWVEWDRFAAGVLVSRMREGSLDEAPVWDDLTTFDGRPWRGVVDLVSAGYPCQPFSVAGKRLGDADERHLWPEVARVIREVGPRLVVLENVAGHVRLGLERVLGELADLGFDAEWSCFRASEAGAPHRRERVFVLAYSNGRREQQLPRRVSDKWPGVRDRGEDSLRGDASRMGGWDVADGERHEPQRWRRADSWDGFAEDGLSDGWCGAVPVANGGDAGPPCAGLDTQPGGSFEFAGDGDREAMGDATGARCSFREPGACRAVRDEGWREAPDGRSELVGDAAPERHERAGRARGRSARPSDAGRFPLAFPPGPGDRAAWERLLDADPALAPAVEPGVRGVADGVPARLESAVRRHRLRCLGNAVVPAQAELAIRELLERIGD